MAIRGKENENGVYEFPYMVKPNQKSKWEAFKLFFMEPKYERSFWQNWFELGYFSMIMLMCVDLEGEISDYDQVTVKILLFYFIFYIGLAALFAICMAALLATIDKDKPKYTSINSLIGTNPGLGFRPIADRTSEGALIWYNSKNVSTTTKWIELLDEFFEEYNISHPSLKSKFSPDCDFDQPPRNGLACPVNIDMFGPCSPPNYAYNTSSPCVFLKLNKIFDWEPEYINSTEKIPEGIPKELISRIKLAAINNHTNRVWVSCEGEYDADKEHLSNSSFEYYPTGGGFPSYYYPFKHKKNAYLSPLVAVRIMNPTGGVIINIECRAWAHNIEYIGGPAEHRKGSVHFEVMRDDI